MAVGIIAGAGAGLKTWEAKAFAAEAQRKATARLARQASPGAFSCWT